jgi:translation initiation factor 1
MSDRRIVYSTGPDGSQGARGRTCSRCNREPCACEPTRSVEPAAQQVCVRRERSGRKGKTVTVCAPLLLTRDDASRLLRDLKRRCGAGGTLRLESDGTGSPAFSLELQGDLADRVVEVLVDLGFGVKRAGG